MRQGTCYKTGRCASLENYYDGSEYRIVMVLLRQLSYRLFLLLLEALCMIIAVHLGIVRIFFSPKRHSLAP